VGSDCKRVLAWQPEERRGKVVAVQLFESPVL